MRRWLINLGIAIWLVRGTLAPGADPATVARAALELKDGDRVVLIGGTFVEREQESGYLETRLARLYPGRKIVFRNLGWSGDTVEGVSRGESLGPTAGFRQLVDHVVALKPTVIVLGYGANESFNGVGGLPAFQSGLDRLWTALAKTGAKMVVLTPTRQENLGPPLPDPTFHNADLARYGDLLRAEAARRGAVAVDLFPTFDGFQSRPNPWTSNGIHLTAAGYWKVSAAIAPAFSGQPDPSWRLAIANGQAEGTGTTVSNLEARPSGVTFRLLDEVLASPRFPEGVGPLAMQSMERVLKVSGLAPGRYRLAIDGQAVEVADAEVWRAGKALAHGPEFDQIETVRDRIIRKNLLYFHRWRPQNETYLFGFRKHEQGKNAAELAAFDPLVADLEAEIARLSKPLPHTYELIRDQEGEVPR